MDIKDFKAQLIEKMLECHRLAITVFYPSSRDTGKNEIELDFLE
jgi:hypothetical protein